MKRYLALVAFPIYALCSLAFANPPPYEDIDANSDGEIDRAEAELVAWLDFLTADVDQDGRVSREEYARIENAPAPPYSLPSPPFALIVE